MNKRILLTLIGKIKNKLFMQRNKGLLVANNEHTKKMNILYSITGCKIICVWRLLHKWSKIVKD